MEQATTPTPRTPEVQQPRANSTEQVDKPATNIMERLGAKSQQNPVEIQVPYRNPVEIQVPYQKSCSDTGPILPVAIQVPQYKIPVWKIQHNIPVAIQT